MINDLNRRIAEAQRELLALTTIYWQHVRNHDKDAAILILYKTKWLEGYIDALTTLKLDYMTPEDFE